MAEREDATRKRGRGCLERNDLRGRRRGGRGRGGERFLRLLLSGGERLFVRAIERGGAALGVFWGSRHEDYGVRD